VARSCPARELDEAIAAAKRSLPPERFAAA
jgi:hypothetical protein